MIKHILTKDQRAARLDTFEDDHTLYIVDTTSKAPEGCVGFEEIIAVFSASGATIQEIQQAANDYLIERG